MSAEKHKWSGAEVLVMLAAAPPAMLWWAYVAHALWHWFAVPVGAPPIGMAHAYGVSLLLRFISRDSDSAAADGGPYVAVARWVIAPAFVLLMGFVIHSAMTA